MHFAPAKFWLMTHMVSAILMDVNSLFTKNYPQPYGIFISCSEVL